MKVKSWLIGSVLSVGLLAGCGLFPGIGGQQILGSFSGDWTTGVSNLRLALVGIGANGVTSYDNQLEIKDPNVTKGYVMELPLSANEGSYKVIAYSDTNANSKLDASDTVLGDTCSKYMLFSNAAGSRTFYVGSVQTLTVKKGWNGYDASTPANAPFQGESYPNYHLYRTGTCPS